MLIVRWLRNLQVIASSATEPALAGDWTEVQALGWKRVRGITPEWNFTLREDIKLKSALF